MPLLIGWRALRLQNRSRTSGHCCRWPSVAERARRMPSSLQAPGRMARDRWPAGTWVGRATGSHGFKPATHATVPAGELTALDTVGDIVSHCAPHCWAGATSASTSRRPSCECHTRRSRPSDSDMSAGDTPSVCMQWARRRRTAVSTYALVHAIGTHGTGVASVSSELAAWHDAYCRSLQCSAATSWHRSHP